MIAPSKIHHLLKGSRKAILRRKNNLQTEGLEGGNKGLKVILPHGKIRGNPIRNFSTEN